MLVLSLKDSNPKILGITKLFSSKEEEAANIIILISTVGEI